MRAAYTDALHYTAKLTGLKLWNYLRLIMSYYISLLTRKSMHSGMPFSLSIEPTTSCNLRCQECPGGLKQFTRPQGMMAIRDFQNAIGEAGNSLTYLMFYFQGEPLLNPDLFRMIEHARKKRIYTATSTNAQHLNDENARRLVESGLDRLIISLDGCDQEIYEKYRVGGDIEKVKDGVRNVMKWKKKLHSSGPYVIIQFLVLKSNEHQIREVKQLSKELGADRLDLKTAQVYQFEKDTELIPDNPEYARYIRGRDGSWELKKRIRNRCFRMWSGAVITWDGMVVPCCFDKDAAHQLGKLDHFSLKEIWRGEAYNKFRMQILKDRSQINICKNCSE